jgi:hypothetical protein
MNKYTHGYMTVWYTKGIKFCELFCGHSSSSQEFVTVGINLGTVWLLFYYWTSKLINLLLFPSFPNSHHLLTNSPRYKWVGKSLICQFAYIEVGYNEKISSPWESQFVNTYCKYTILYKVTPSQYEYSLVHS